MKKPFNHFDTKAMRPDYFKIVLVGIPIGFVTWFVSIFPTIYIVRLLDIRDYWLYISLLLTIVVMSGYFVFCIKNPLKIGAAIVSDPMALKSIEDGLICELCGKLIKDRHTARIRQKSISGKNLLYCYDCYDKNIFSSYKFTLIFNIIQLLFGLFLIEIAPDEIIGWFILNMLLVSFSSILMIIPHELGHVIVAKMLGVFVPAVIIGRGKTVFVKRFFKVSWEFKNIPFGGITIALISEHFSYRRKLFLISIAGPLVNLIFILLMLLIFPISKLFTGIFALHVSFFSALFFANLIDLIYNLFPIHLDTSIGKIPSDGWNLIVLPFLSEDAIKQRIKDTNRVIRQIDS